MLNITFNSVTKWLVFLKINFKWTFKAGKSNLNVKIGRIKYPIMFNPNVIHFSFVFYWKLCILAQKLELHTSYQGLQYLKPLLKKTLFSLCTLLPYSLFWSALWYIDVQVASKLCHVGWTREYRTTFHHYDSICTPLSMYVQEFKWTEMCVCLP